MNYIICVLKHIGFYAAGMSGVSFRVEVGLCMGEVMHGVLKPDRQRITELGVIFYSLS